jgi:hypothetical protein
MAGVLLFFSIINERNILFVMIKLGLTQPDVGDGILFFSWETSPMAHYADIRAQ